MFFCPKSIKIFEAQKGTDTNWQKNTTERLLKKKQKQKQPLKCKSVFCENCNSQIISFQNIVVAVFFCWRYFCVPPYVDCRREVKYATGLLNLCLTPSQETSVVYILCAYRSTLPCTHSRDISSDLNILSLITPHLNR